MSLLRGPLFSTLFSPILLFFSFRFHIVSRPILSATEGPGSGLWRVVRPLLYVVRLIICVTSMSAATDGSFCIDYCPIERQCRPDVRDDSMLPPSSCTEPVIAPFRIDFHCAAHSAHSAVIPRFYVVQATSDWNIIKLSTPTDSWSKITFAISSNMSLTS